MTDLPLHLRSGGVSLVLGSDEGHSPYVAYWGVDLGDLTPEDLSALVLLGRPQLTPNTVDEHHPVGILAEHWTGWSGTPSLQGSRRGQAWSPAMMVEGIEVTTPSGPVVEHHVLVHLRDVHASLSMTLEIEVMRTGLVRLRSTVTNEGTHPYQVDALEPGLTVPPVADELLDFTGRHVRERSPQRRQISVGTYSREGRRGRTGTDATLLMIAGKHRLQVPPR